MVSLAWFWVKVEQLCWLVYAWIALMMLGVVLTDIGIFLNVGWILLHLCSIWLGVTAVGYFCTAWGLRSRAFLLTGLLHGVSMALLSLSAGWQYAATGIVMSSSLLLLAEVQWDMRPPSATAFLSAEQQQFNQEQHQLRQAETVKAVL
jgi:hypothetical protein